MRACAAIHGSVSQRWMKLDGHEFPGTPNVGYVYVWWWSVMMETLTDS